MPHVLLPLAILLLLPCAAWAEGVPIDPGKWKVVSTVTLPMQPPRVEESTECIERDEFGPENLTRDEGPCHNEDVSVSGDTVTWTVSCDNGMGTKTKGSGRFTSDGDQVEGIMTMRMPVHGQHMEVSTAWKGERLGECD